jgi:tRNA(fMet)-specific endonuclease VapC
MVKFMLDTNVVSHAVRDPQGRVARQLASAGADAVALSIVVASELRFGLAKIAHTGSTRLGDRVTSAPRLSGRASQLDPTTY